MKKFLLICLCAFPGLNAMEGTTSALKKLKLEGTSQSPTAMEIEEKTVPSLKQLALQKLTQQKLTPIDLISLLNKEIDQTDRNTVKSIVLKKLQKIGFNEFFNQLAEIEKEKEISPVVIEFLAQNLQNIPRYLKQGKSQITDLDLFLKLTIGFIQSPAIVSIS